MVKNRKRRASEVGAGEPHDPARSEPEDILVDDVEADVASSSESEDEDDNADLVTDTIDAGIDRVLQALKTDADVLKNKEYRFFPDVAAEGTPESTAKAGAAKPVYLKDYVREQYLAQAQQPGADEPEPAETFNEEQARLREDVVREFHASDDDDELLVARTVEREIPDVDLPDPETDADGFLQKYLATKSWIPKEEPRPSYNEIVEEDEFEDQNEQFEHAYNFRFEDPDAAKIVSYARDQSSTRRDKLSSRQKKREKLREARAKEEEQQKLEIARERKSKVSEVAEKLRKVQEALGSDDAALAEMLANEDLEGDFDAAEWDRRMQKLFDDEFYSRAESGGYSGQLDGAGTDDDDVAHEGSDNGRPRATETNENADEGVGVDVGEDIGEDVEGEDIRLDQTPGAATAPAAKPLTKQEARKKAEEFVNANEDLLLSAAKLRQEKNTGFRYREVDAESFGLSARDILLASDKELNQFATLKKLASYREKDEQERIRRKYGKRKRLRQWRREVFGTEESPDDSLWEQAKREAKEELERVAKPSKKEKARKHKDKKPAKKQKVRA